MNRNFLQKSLLGLLTLSVSSIYASGCSTDGQNERMKKHEVHKRVQSSSEQKMSGEWGSSYPSSDGCPPNEDFIISLDYLIMRSKNENLYYAFQANNDGVQGAFLGQIRYGNVVTANRTWRPGFRVNFGWNTPFDYWDTNINWTYYYNKSVTNRKNSPIVFAGGLNSNDGFYPYWAIPFSTDGSFAPGGGGTVSYGFYQDLKGVWQLNYNMLDWDVGRSVHLTKAFAIRPFIAVRNGWIHQKMVVKYLNSYAGGGYNTSTAADTFSVNNNKFWGIGFNTGFNMDWDLPMGVSLKSGFSASLLSGRTHVRRIQNEEINILTGRGQDFRRIDNETFSITHLAPSFEMNLGLGWGMCFSENTKFFGLDVLWQTMHWWNQFSFIRPSHVDTRITSRLRDVLDYPATDKALTIEGIVVRGRLDF